PSRRRSDHLRRLPRTRMPLIHRHLRRMRWPHRKSLRTPTRQRSDEPPARAELDLRGQPRAVVAADADAPAAGVGAAETVLTGAGADLLGAGITRPRQSRSRIPRGPGRGPAGWRVAGRTGAAA